MTNPYESLSWLPNPPLDFSQNLAAARSGSELWALAKYCIDENQLRRLSKKLQSMQDHRSDLAPLIPISIGIISNATTKLIAPSIVGTALRFGIALTLVEAEYNRCASKLGRKSYCKILLLLQKAYLVVTRGAYQELSHGYVLI